MSMRNDVVISKNEKSKTRPYLVRWWGKYDVKAEKQPRFCRSFAKKKDAEKYAQTLKDDISDGISVEPQKITLGNLCEKVIAAKKGSVAPTSLKTYSNTAQRLINHFGSHRNIKTVGKEEAEAFLAGVTLIKDNAVSSDSTRAKHLRNARLIFNKAIDWNHIRGNPFRGITLGKINKEDWHCITPIEFNAILRQIDKTSVKSNDKQKLCTKAFYSVMYDCGLRFGEAINLLWTNGNIDFINCKIHIINRSSQKGIPPFSIKDHEARTVPCTKRVMELLTELKKVSNPNNPYVFLSDDRYQTILDTWKELSDQGNEDTWLNSKMVNNTNRNFKIYCKSAGITTSDKLSVHCFRKGYGTNIANLGTPIHTLKQLMGHSNVETTMEFYLHSSDANQKKAIEGLDKLAFV